MLVKLYIRAAHSGRSWKTKTTMCVSLYTQKGMLFSVNSEELATTKKKVSCRYFAVQKCIHPCSNSSPAPRVPLLWNVGLYLWQRRCTQTFISCHWFSQLSVRGRTVMRTNWQKLVWEITNKSKNSSSFHRCQNSVTTGPVRVRWYND